jgi:hypothetical protein
VDGDDVGVAVVGGEGGRGDERREEGAHLRLFAGRRQSWSSGVVCGGGEGEADARRGKGSNYSGSVSFVPACAPGFDLHCLPTCYFLEC